MEPVGQPLLYRVQLFVSVTMSSRWDWMLGIIFMVAISVIVIVATFACIVFCKCKKKLKQAKTVGIEPTATDDDTGKVPVADTGSVITFHTIICIHLPRIIPSITYENLYLIYSSIETYTRPIYPLYTIFTSFRRRALYKNIAKCSNFKCLHFVFSK